MMLIQMPGQCSPPRVSEGEGSPVTKLADEACDLFKGMPKSQPQNELGHKMTHLDTETSVCVCVCVCVCVRVCAELCTNYNLHN